MQRPTNDSPKRRSILIIEDDTDLCLMMSEFLERQGFSVDMAHDGGRGLACALQRPFDLVILDAMLPVLDGFVLLQELRARSSVPVIMLTARVEERDRIAGLDAGADDYLSKPLRPGELVARVRAVLRRVGKPLPFPASVFECGDLQLNPETREVWVAGEPLHVTTTEFEILKSLVRAAGRIVSRDELATILHQRLSTPFERSLDVHISRIRRKIERDNRCFIRTVRGMGYLFAAASEKPA